MQVAPGCIDRGVAQGRLNQVDRCPAVERMGSVSVPEPMRRHGEIDARSLRRGPGNPQNCGRLQSGPELTRAEHRLAVAATSAKPLQDRGYGDRELNGARLAALP